LLGTKNFARQATFKPAPVNAAVGFFITAGGGLGEGQLRV
jgi:hypothetical protein